MGIGGRIGSCAAAVAVVVVGVVAPASAADSPPIVDTFARPGTDQVWSLDSAGVVTAFNGAPHYGDLSAGQLVARDPSGASAVAATSSVSGDGYWIVAADSAVFAFGDAPYLGSLYDQLRREGIPATAENVGSVLDGPVYEIARHPASDGYWLAARDGGVFSFGVPFHGSAWAQIHGQGRTAVAFTVASDGGSYEMADNLGNLYRCTGTCALVAGPDTDVDAVGGAGARFRTLASSLNCTQVSKPDVTAADLDGDGRIDASEWTAFAARVRPWYRRMAVESAAFASAVRRVGWPPGGQPLADTVADWADADARFYGELATAGYETFFVLRQTASVRPEVWNDLRAWLGLPAADADRTDWCALAAQP